jgi:ParB/RepB/Spo0J family partition protein
MATTAPVAPQTNAVQLRSVALSAIVALDGWNPRMSFDDGELRALSASMVDRGCLVPVILQATGNGDYRLVDGEKRYKAAVLGAMMELPAIIRPVDAADDTAELEAELLVDAFVANQHRSPLSLVEQALACRRLKVDHGLTVKGIAEKLQLKQARVKERLALLELPEQLWPRIAAGEIPVGAIAALLALGKIHPGLPEVAVTLVLDRGDVYDAEPWTWRDVADDPLKVVAGGLHDETVDAPAGVFVSTSSYALSAFTLDDKGAAAAAKFAELRGSEVDALQIRFDHNMVEQAHKLNAAHTPDHGWVTLIVGQDVGDQLAADTVIAGLKRARAEAKRARDATRSAAAAPSSSTTGAHAGDAAGVGAAAPSEEQQREAARAERAAAAAHREQCAVFNEQLGVAIVNSLSRVKVDERTVKILTAINVAAELDRIAMRGARYGFPGWVTVEETKRGSKRHYLEHRHEAEAKAVEYLAGAKTAGELAGRTIALVMMAVYAQEDAVANSNQAFHTVTPLRVLPWAADVAELIDELAGEKLPAALMDPVLQERRARHAERHAAAARKAAALERIAELQPRIAALGADELDELEHLAAVGHGEYMPATLTLRSQVRARRQQLTDAAASTADPEDAGHEAGAGDEATAAAGDVEPDVDVDEPVDDTAATDSDSEQQSA